jgi:SAM-dependent methyltransferase
MNQEKLVSKFNAAYILADRARHSLEQNCIEVGELYSLLSMHSGERLLDVGCGYGRHMVEFGRLNLQVVGVDSSRSMIKETISVMQDAGQSAEVDCIPIAQMKYRRRFHYVTMLYNSFGYGVDVANDAATLRAIHNSLMPVGQFVIDVTNPKSEKIQSGKVNVAKLPDMTIEETHSYYPTHDLWLLRQKVVRGSWSQEWQMVYRRYDLADLKQILLTCDFRINDIFGDYKGTPFHATGSRRMVLLCSHAPPQ